MTYKYLFYISKCFFVASCLSIPHVVDARPQGYVEAGITHFPPFYVVEESGSLSGIYLDIMLNTLKEAGIKYILTDFPTKRLYRNLGNGSTHVFVGIKGSPEYHNKVYYSKVPISQIQLRVYAIGDTVLPKIKQDLIGKSIITLRGYGYAGLVKYFDDPKNNINVKSTTEHYSSFLMLKNKRADYLFNYKHPSDTVLKTLSVPGLKFTSFYSADVFFIVSKSAPNAENLLKKLEESYARLIKTGVIEYIENDDAN